MKTVIEMARESGFWQEHIDTWMCSAKDMERFAALVRADEREACAKLCGELHIEGEDDTGLAGDLIRARGNT